MCDELNELTSRLIRLREEFSDHFRRPLTADFGSDEFGSGRCKRTFDNRGGGSAYVVMHGVDSLAGQGFRVNLSVTNADSVTHSGVLVQLQYSNRIPNQLLQSNFVATRDITGSAEAQANVDSIFAGIELRSRDATDWTSDRTFQPGETWELGVELFDDIDFESIEFISVSVDYLNAVINGIIYRIDGL